MIKKTSQEKLAAAHASCVVFQVTVDAGEMIVVPPGFVWCEYSTDAVIGLRVPIVDVKSSEVFEIMERDFGVMSLGVAPPNLKSIIQVLNTMKAGQDSAVKVARASPPAFRVAGKSPPAIPARQASPVPSRSAGEVGGIATPTDVKSDERAVSPGTHVSAFVEDPLGWGALADDKAKKPNDEGKKPDDVWELERDDATPPMVGEIWLKWVDDVEPQVIAETQGFVISQGDLDKIEGEGDVGEKLSEQYAKLKLVEVEIQKVNADNTFDGVVHSMDTSIHGTEVKGIARKFFFAPNAEL